MAAVYTRLTAAAGHVSHGFRGLRTHLAAQDLTGSKMLERPQLQAGFDSAGVYLSEQVVLLVLLVLTGCRITRRFLRGLTSTTTAACSTTSSYTAFEYLPTPCNVD